MLLTTSGQLVSSSPTLSICLSLLPSSPSTYTFCFSLNKKAKVSLNIKKCSHQILTSFGLCQVVFVFLVDSQAKRSFKNLQLGLLRWLSY